VAMAKWARRFRPIIQDEHYGMQANLVWLATRCEEDKLLGVRDLGATETLEGIQAFITIRHAQKCNVLWWSLLRHTLKDTWWEVERWYWVWNRDTEQFYFGPLPRELKEYFGEQYAVYAMGGEFFISNLKDYGERDRVTRYIAEGAYKGPCDFDWSSVPFWIQEYLSSGHSRHGEEYYYPGFRGGWVAEKLDEDERQALDAWMKEHRIETNSGGHRVIGEFLKGIGKESILEPPSEREPERAIERNEEER